MWSCFDCNNLDRSKKEMSENNYCFRYGCKASKKGYICFWTKTQSTESEINTSLKEGGCSSFKEKERKEQLTLF